MDELFSQIWRKKYAFIAVFFVVFSLTYLVFLALDFLPEPPAEEVGSETALLLNEESTTSVDAEDAPEASAAVVEAYEGAAGAVLEMTPEAVLPVTITIPRLEKSIPVLNPTSRTIADLDAALLEGVVRHPDSANLAQDGNIFILGHSSYLPNILNRNFQAFNGIQNLEWGDVIEVVSEDAVYEYRVEKVYRARAQDVTVPIAGTGKMLTLATCNSFGSVDDRYIVEAKQIGVTAL